MQTLRTRFFAFLIASISLLFLAGCGNSAETTNTGGLGSEETETTEDRELRLVSSAILPFLAALKERNYDKAIMETDVPFLGGYTGKQTRAETKDDVKAALKYFVQKWNDPATFPTDAFEAKHWEPETQLKGAQKPYFESMMEVAGKDGYRVPVGSKTPAGGLLIKGGQVLVKVIGGKPKIVGLFLN
jgi:hypothetical protein